MDICPICHDGCSTRHRLQNCGHLFHKSCMARWVRRNNKTCPLCRQILTVMDIAYFTEVAHEMDHRSFNYFVYSDTFYQFPAKLRSFMGRTFFTYRKNTTFMRVPLDPWGPSKAIGYIFNLILRTDENIPAVLFEELQRHHICRYPTCYETCPIRLSNLVKDRIVP